VLMSSSGSPKVLARPTSRVSSSMRSREEASLRLPTSFQPASTPVSFFRRR
jgi:hypothetical protein